MFEDLAKNIANTVPLSTTQREQILALRAWANVRAVSATKTSCLKEYTKEIKASNYTSSIVVDIEDFIPWSPENPFLYDVIFELGTGDKVNSYFGMRKIEIRGNKFFLNNEEIFLRFVLDQGFYPEGIWTAPSDEALKNDIILSKNAGFNGARLHQKVFEERFLYHADKLGYLVWEENYDWGLTWDNLENMLTLEREWIDQLYRDINHPSIIAWTPFNETASCTATAQMRDNHNKFLKEIYDITHLIDHTRPVNDSSGHLHVETDIYSIHVAQQDPEILKKNYEKLEIGKMYEAKESIPMCKYNGQPFILDEYGGPCWAPDVDKSEIWGYSKMDNIEDVYNIIEGTTKALVEMDSMSGFCSIQLTDVEQEKNGIYKYNREPKFDMDRIKKIFTYPRKK